MTTRLPRPILTLLTILSIAGSFLSMMDQSAASVVPMPGTDSQPGNRLQICATSPKPVLHQSLGDRDASITPPELGALADALQDWDRTLLPSCPLNPWQSLAIRSARLNQDDGPSHSVRMRKATPLAGCVNGPRPTSDGDRNRSETLANPAGDDEPHPKRHGTNPAKTPIQISRKTGRECPCCEA
jgi:hypothetical protein